MLNELVKKKDLMPTCRNCVSRKAKASSLFCTDKCGRMYADNLLCVDDEGWCQICRRWVSIEIDACKVCGFAQVLSCYDIIST